ncbi:3-oxoadipate enol-lactonase [Pelagibacterium sp. 26DY04]|uniref:3-oxoadipate enol-lactonase n=1 Tax=Pelagibacterium sp. 26DY04 TaxID=2967130 RepID=UPI002814A811|nr:3-oxoadipate enol-lactonase [Pelagibacterium sp. 26DY04]WMT85449.1 3-oxoadipate enol-lactonase [Pelagibacterium sp. 26DY04]
MDCVQLGDIVVHYRLRRAAAGAQTVVFINSLGTDFRIWDDVVAALDGDLGILLYDKRGHGLSSIGSTPYRIADHADDLVSLLAALGITEAVICGLSIGGQIAQQVYFDRPELVAGLVLCDTAARIGDADFWNNRIDAIARNGIESVTDGIMERWFSAGFRNSGKPEYQIARAMFERQPVAGYLATCAAIAGFDRRADTASIAVPVSVLVGAEDGATPPDLVADFARQIQASQFEIIEGAGHLPCIEAPAQVAAAIAALVGRVEQGRMRDVAS